MHRQQPEVDAVSGAPQAVNKAEEYSTMKGTKEMVGEEWM